MCVIVGWSRAEFESFRANITSNFFQTLDLVPHLAERVRSGRQEERFVGTADIPNFFRKPYRADWALVGDAGFHKDPFLAQGITDAFRDAELLARAIDAGLSGRGPLEEALAAYERQRNEMALLLYKFTLQAATLKPISSQTRQLFAALRGNQEQTNRFFGVAEGTVPFAEFFAPENIRRLIAEAAGNAIT
jgi:2-polyprenyl-6-methoxyphenol hydroxylase-like FAD-dependent oxidoreductase